MKKCTKCKETKDSCEFGKQKTVKTGLKSWCKSCEKKYRLDNKKHVAAKEKQRQEAIKANYELNLAKSEAKQYKECTKCKEDKKVSEFHKAKSTTTGLMSQCKSCKKLYREANIEAEIARSKEYRKNNKERNSKRNRDRRKTDINYKLAELLRGRFYKAIKINKKPGSAVRDLGCSLEDLKIHLEQQFQEGMNWDNWSRTGWHIDHVKPLASFDLTNREELLKACHFSNLQPLWAKNNLSKGCRF